MADTLHDLLGETVHLVTGGRDGAGERAAIITSTRTAGGWLVVANLTALAPGGENYAVRDVPYSSGKEARTWHKRGD